MEPPRRVREWWTTAQSRALALAERRALRIVALAVRSYVRGDGGTRAAALSFNTVLSLVPMLALVFSVAKGFGAYDRLVASTIRPFLDHAFGRAGGGQLRRAVDQVLLFVENTNVSSLGLFGLATLAYTVVVLMGNVEDAFNHIWGVSSLRPLRRRVTDYLAMVFIAPVLMVTATGLTAAAQHHRAVSLLGYTLRLGGLIDVALALSPLVAVWVGFATIYMVMPNTRTRLSSALVGALVAGTGWQLVQVALVRFQLGVAEYNAIYAGFAAVPVFLVWVNLTWTVVLFGAELAHAHQRAPSLGPLEPGEELSQAWRERVALHALAHIGAAFTRGDPPWTVARLARRVGVSETVLDDALRPLRRKSLLADALDGDALCLVPTRALDAIPLKSVLDALRGDAPDLPSDRDSPAGAAAEATLSSLDRELAGAFHDRTLRDLARAALSDRPSPADDDARRPSHRPPAPQAT